MVTAPTGRGPGSSRWWPQTGKGAREALQTGVLWFSSVGRPAGVVVPRAEGDEGRASGPGKVVGAGAGDDEGHAPATRAVVKRRQMMVVIGGEEVPGTGGEACRAPEPGEPTEGVGDV